MNDFLILTWTQPQWALKSTAIDNSQCMNSWWKTFIPVNWHGINRFSYRLHAKALNTRTQIFCRWANFATTNRNKLINNNCIVTLPPLQFPLCILAKQHGNVIIVNVIKTQQDFPLDLRNTFSTLYMKYSVGIKVSSFHTYWSLDIFKYTCPLLYYGRDNLFSYILVSFFNPYGALYLDQMIKIFVDWVIA